MLKSMAPNLCKNVFYHDNRDYGVKTDIGGFLTIARRKGFKLALLRFVFNLINEAIKTPVKMEERSKNI